MKCPITLFLFLLSLIHFGCNTTKPFENNPKPTNTNKKTLPKTIYFIDIDIDGSYEIIELDEVQKPQPNQGKQQFTIDFYRAFRYPASARTNSIEGIVILEVVVNSSGKVTSVITKKGLSSDCDQAAEKAYFVASQLGFQPLIINNKPTNFKMELCVGFWLD